MSEFNGDWNLLKGLTSLPRLSARDKRKLEERLRFLSLEAECANDSLVAAKLLWSALELRAL